MNIKEEVNFINLYTKVFYCMLSVFEIRLLQSGTFNIEVLYLLVIHRVLWNGNSVKSGKGHYNNYNYCCITVKLKQVLF